MIYKLERNLELISELHFFYSRKELEKLISNYKLLKSNLGKPYLADKHNQDEFKYNISISHKDDYIVAIIGSEYLGCDIERIVIVKVGSYILQMKKR